MSIQRFDPLLCNFLQSQPTHIVRGTKAFLYLLQKHFPAVELMSPRSTAGELLSACCAYGLISHPPAVHMHTHTVYTQQFTEQ